MNGMKCKLKLKFEDSFFIQEECCGFVVTEKAKRIRAVQLDLLNELLRVCKSYNIVVAAFAGTLLGAVRHKGFIPWDDDVDVCLDRNNFNKLLQHIEEFKHPYFLQTAYNDNRFFFGYARLRNSLTTGIIKWEAAKDYNCGIYIDIFVLDGFTENKAILKKQLEWRRNIERKIDLFHLEKYKNIKYLLKKIKRAVLLKNVLYDDLLKEYEDCLSSNTGSTERLTLMTHGVEFLEKYWCRKADFLDIVEVPFENIRIPIFKEYDFVLRNMYGDYMQLPPIEDRGKWHDDNIIYDPDVPYYTYFNNILSKNNGKY